MRAARRTWLPLAALAVSLTTWASTTAAATPNPAFYTWQAPGGTATHGEKVIALTFDDGPGPYTPQVLSVLEHYGVPATFFEIGENVVSYPQYTRMLAGAGYPVEDHTWTHPDLETLPVSEFPYEIDQTQREIQSLTGIAPSCVRPPYDDWSSTVLDQIAERGLTTMSYSVDPRDWSLPGEQAIVDAVVGGAFPGAVVDMHDGGGNRSETVAALPQIIQDLRARGYSFVSICGPTRSTSDVYSLGNAPPAGTAFVASALLVGVAGGGETGGYWITSSDGAVFAYREQVYGSTGGSHLNKPMVAIAATGDEHGYWLAASDGGVFAFGDAHFYGSTGGIHLNAPVVGMAADPATGGYWLVASDGGVFSFDAPFYGSMGGTHLNQPVVGIASMPDGHGYRLVAADGGVFAFGDARYYGSTASVRLNAPIVGLANDATTGGYWLLASDGGVFSFDAPFYGSMAGRAGDARFYAIAAYGGRGYWLAGQKPAY